MLSKIKLENVLFLDIETVPQYQNFESVPENFQNLWEKKSEYFRTEEQNAGDVYARAGIYAEFGKIVCISVGLINFKNTNKYLRLKSFYGDDEKNLLEEFGEMLSKLAQKKDIILCAHNGKEFDYPYIARRCLINGLKLPNILDIAGKKPWEVRHLDTLELWKFGDYKNYTSLNLLVAVFDLPSPKDDIDGSQVGDIYWNENDIKRITKYCEKDVVAVVQLFLKYRIEDIISDENIESVTY
ncbi:MAG: 3'-5' exonuclease [Bacteroidetes bacterium]|jgi:hypothetical protein|nr:3'-5' exonuclease [Bacteroidota bacterium]MBT6686483.1 3'-5' exonuclease [Bacteroidota bacterium]MBT7142712.1 3'-5' exonuclease [Bacteroidota bacterium]MBT7491164.1 3'-5' exonuclease [Bacteroidota bacterium]